MLTLIGVSMRKHGFYVGLGLFVGISLTIFAFELSGRRGLAMEKTSAAIPHTPGDFRWLFAFNPLKGLGEGSGDVHAKPPPFSEGTWPCSDCHNSKKLKDNPNRRVLVKEHSNIELHHGEENRWCLDCHDFKNRDRLHLVNGTLVEFEESDRLCGQCHGQIHRDWKAGVHGQRTGFWNGPKRYLLCVNCHWPHSPHFNALEPLPPPVRPEQIGLGLFRTKAGGVEHPADAPAVSEGAKTAEGAKQ